MFIFFSRLAISENGCNAILEHENSQHILSKLVHSLGVDEAGTVFCQCYVWFCWLILSYLENNIIMKTSFWYLVILQVSHLSYFWDFLKPAGFTLIKDFDVAGRGMNAAFAIGRLCDMEVGRKRLLLLSDSEKMVCHYIVFVKSLEIRRICNLFLFQFLNKLLIK